MFATSPEPKKWLNFSHVLLFVFVTEGQNDGVGHRRSVDLRRVFSNSSCPVRLFDDSPHRAMSRGESPSRSQGPARGQRARATRAVLLCRGTLCGLVGWNCRKDWNLEVFATAGRHPVSAWVRQGSHCLSLECFSLDIWHCFMMFYARDPPDHPNDEEW